jgi:aspartate-semialdehyde dehydrogenase
MAEGGVRIGLLGATGALGGEVLAALDASPIRVAGIVPVASDRSLGEDIEFQDEIYPVETSWPRLENLDLVFCCAPVEPSLEVVRRALRARVPCVDCSGALIGESGVPVGVAALADAADARSPVVSAPAGPALPWSLVLAPLHAAAGITRVVGTVLEAASVLGRGGIEALSAESLALFNQRDPPSPEAAGRPLAFDCLPAVGIVGVDGTTPRESEVGPGLRRILATDLETVVSVIQVPAFVGQASQLMLETERPLDPKQARDALSSAPGVECWVHDAEGPNLRAVAGRVTVVAGRIRPAPSARGGLLLWIAADMLRLAAANAVALAAARLLPR